MTDSDKLYPGTEIDDDLSNAMDTETIAGRGLVTPGFDNAPRAPTKGLKTEIFAHRRYLKVERNTTLRKTAKVSKIWNHAGGGRKEKIIPSLFKVCLAGRRGL